MDAPYRIEHHRTPLAADVAHRMEHGKQDPRPANVTLTDTGFWLFDLPVGTFLLAREEEDGSIREWYFNSVQQRLDFRLALEQEADREDG